jgi:hypothetical protein
VSTPVVEFTVHPVVPALVTEYVIETEPSAEANDEGVAGESVESKAVPGDHVTLCEALEILKVSVICVAAVNAELPLCEYSSTQLPAPLNVTTPPEIVQILDEELATAITTLKDELEVAVGV